MFQRISFILAVFLALLALRIPALRAAFAAPAVVTFDVTSTLDDIDDNPGNGTCHTSVAGPAAGLCTLRAAVMEANRASGAGATIMLRTDIYTLTIPVAGLGGDLNGGLDLTTPSSGNPLISIVGAGAESTIIDGNQLDRVLTVYQNRIASISGLAIRHGYFVAEQLDSGGGILNSGTLTVTDSVISDNEGDHGGGIQNGHTLTLLRSTISHNSALGSGGGIINYALLNINQSTFSHNSAGSSGGGIFNYALLNINQSTISHNSAYTGYGGGLIGNTRYTVGSLVTIVNSTISQNDAAVDGGGIYINSGSANVYNTSIVFNVADANTDLYGSGGGVSNNVGATFNVRNVLLAGNKLSNASVYDDCRGTLGVYGVNLIGTGAASVHCTITGPGSSAYLNSLSLVGPLQNNGGPTWTHALLPGSNAIDGGDPVFGCTDNSDQTLTIDQRGAAPPLGARCDAGAFEYRPPLYLPLIRR